MDGLPLQCMKTFHLLNGFCFKCAVAAHLYAGKSSLIEQPVTFCTTMHVYVQMGPHHANAWIIQDLLDL